MWRILWPLALGMACCTADGDADLGLLNTTPEEDPHSVALRKAIDVARVDPCSSDLRFVDTAGVGIWFIELPESEASLPVFAAFPMQHRRIERLIEYHHDRMISLLRDGPKAITLLEILHAEGECGSSATAPRGSRPWVVEEETPIDP